MPRMESPNVRSDLQTHFARTSGAGSLLEVDAWIPHEINARSWSGEALGINDRGQVAGYALNSGTGEVHGFLATPCEGDNANTEGCLEPAAAAGTTREPSSIVLSENVRRLLQQRLGGWHHIRALRTPTN